MGLIRKYIPLHHPCRLFHAGEERLSYLELVKNRVARRREFLPFVPTEPASLAVTDIAREVGKGEAALILPSTHFIFNVFEFDRLPWAAAPRDELIRWKLEKVFPENLDLYHHHAAVIARRHVLSILIRRSLVDQCEEAFARAGLELTEIACSTVTAASALLPRRSCADLWLEMDGAANLLFSSSRGRPLYIRKFRTGDTAETVAEVTRTAEYITNNYQLTPRSFQLVSLDEERKRSVRAGLLEAGLQERSLLPRRLLQFPTTPWQN